MKQIQRENINPHRRDVMKTYMLLDTVLFAIVLAIAAQVLVVMATNPSLRMLGALPGEFLYLKGLTSFFF